MDKLDKIFEEHLEDIYVDNDYGGNELVSVIYERDLKDIKEQLLLHNVSQQRELFINFAEKVVKYYEEMDIGDYDLYKEAKKLINGG
jgi:predicted RecB family nuclease